jgi:ABC-type oligopeptide transport system substrate-binding subunit
MGFLLLLGVAWLSLASCAPGSHQATSSTQEYYPMISDEPPSFYNYDPTLRYWYTAPYWNPDIGP